MCYNYSKLLTPSRGGSDNRKGEELIPVVQHPVTRTREGIGLDAFHCPHDFRHKRCSGPTGRKGGLQQVLCQYVDTRQDIRRNQFFLLNHILIWYVVGPNVRYECDGRGVRAS